MKMTMDRAKRALAQNQLVRKMSREGNPEVHYKFFNEVYDALAEVANVDNATKRPFAALFNWADRVVEIIHTHELDSFSWGQDLLDRLELIKREMEE